MKKAAIVTLVVAAAVIAFSSCKKCETCTAYYTATHLVKAQDHLCSNNIAVNQMVDNFKTDYDYGDSYVECTKD
jgi:hypothetical protein